MSDLYGYADKASTETAFIVTQRLREYLVSSNWPVSAAESVSVTFNNNDGFDLVFLGEGASKAQDLEYGTEYERPTAAIRKFLKDQSTIEHIYTARLEAYLGEIV